MTMRTELSQLAQGGCPDDRLNDFVLAIAAYDRQDYAVCVEKLRDIAADCDTSWSDLVDQLANDIEEAADIAAADCRADAAMGYNER